MFCSILLLLLSYLGVAAYIYSIQKKLLFPGAFKAPYSGQTQSVHGLAYIKQYGLETGPLADKHLCAVFFHGNAENFSDVSKYTDWLTSLGISTYVLGYPGYNSDPSTPSLEELLKYSSKFVEWVISNEALSCENLILFGNSLGTGLAIHEARKYPGCILLLVSPYLSISKAAKSRPFLSLFSWVLKGDLVSEDLIKKIVPRICIVAHSTFDKVIPIEHGRIISNSIANAELIVTDNQKHGSTFDAAKNNIAKRLMELVLQ